MLGVFLKCNTVVLGCVGHNSFYPLKLAQIDSVLLDYAKGTEQLKSQF